MMPRRRVQLTSLFLPRCSLVLVLCLSCVFIGTWCRADTVSTGADSGGKFSGEVEIVHDHTPRHGGVVGMSGNTHIEALLRSDARVLVYLSDRHRTALPLEGVRGTVTLGRDERARSVEIVAAGDRSHLFADFDTLPDDEFELVQIEVSAPHKTIMVEYTLPVSHPSGYEVPLLDGRELSP